MKKILVIFFVIVGIYLLFNFVSNQSWNLFGGDKVETKVTNRVDSIELQAFGAKTTVIPDNTDSVVADLDGKGKVTVDKDGDTIKVSYKRGWFEWMPFFNTATLKVYIPEDYHKDMLVKLGSGKLKMSGNSKNDPMKLNDLTVDMGSGSVELENLAVNEFSHNGSSGNLTIDSLQSKKSDIDISSGNVQINHFTGELNGELSSGQMNIQMDKLVDSVDLHASSGSIKLDLPNDADFTLEGKASSGNISYDFPLTVKNQDKHKFQGVHGAGTHDIDITISSGNVKIY